MALFQRNEGANKPVRVKKPRKSPAQYLREVYFELKKTTWPTKDELRRYVIAVIIFVLISIGVIYLYDFGLSSGFHALYREPVVQVTLPPE
ncbi:MAG: preprotein translocase subunit SecE [Clostridia bacterium]|nr:preprotein translocase subunit SecE [Clostridia bacterium]